MYNFQDNVYQRYPKNDDIHKRTFKCLGAWLLNPMVPTDELASSNLLKSIIQLVVSWDWDGIIRDPESRFGL